MTNLNHTPTERPGVGRAVGTPPRSGAFGEHVMNLDLSERALVHFVFLNIEVH